MNERPVLLIAAKLGETQCLKILIQAGVDVNLSDSYHQTALSLAVKGNHPRCVKQ